VNRRGFLGALATIVAASLALPKRTPTCWRCGKVGGPGRSVPGDTAKRWWKCESCIGRDLRYEEMPIGVGEFAAGEPELGWQEPCEDCGAINALIVGDHALCDRCAKRRGASTHRVLA
jgi:hypothetical protein